MTIKTFHIIAGCLWALCLLTLLLYAAVYFTGFNIRFFESEYRKNGTYETVRMSEGELRKVTLHMIDYMKGKTPGLNIETVVNGETRMFFSDTETSHMADVLGLFNSGRAIKNAAVAILILLSVFLITFRARSDAISIGIASVFSLFLLIMLTLGAIMLIDFDGAFTKFHEIFFANDLWMLDYRVDLLINIVPLQFFTDISELILALFFGAAAIIDAACIAALALSRRKRRKDKTLGASAPTNLMRFASRNRRTKSALKRRRFLSGTPDERGALDPSGILRQRFPKGNRERGISVFHRRRKRFHHHQTALRKRISPRESAVKVF